MWRRIHGNPGQRREPGVISRGRLRLGQGPHVEFRLRLESCAGTPPASGRKGTQVGLLTSFEPGSLVPAARQRREVSVARSSNSRPLGASHRKRMGLTDVTDAFTRWYRAAVAYGRWVLDRPGTEPSARPESDQSHNDSRPTSQILVGGGGMRFYHRAGCPMTAERNWPAATAAEHSRAGRTPCGMCMP
jgi:hypothetical protein